MATSTISNFAGIANPSQVLLTQISYVTTQRPPVGPRLCAFGVQGSRPDEKAPSLEFPIFTTSGLSAAAQSEAFSAMTPAAVTVGSTSIAPALQGTSSGYTNQAITDSALSDIDAEEIVKQAQNLAMEKRINTLRNTDILTLTQSAGTSGTALVWDTIRAAVIKVRSTNGVGNDSVLAMRLPWKGINDLMGDTTSSMASYLANPMAQNTETAARLSVSLADWFAGEVPQFYYVPELRLVIFVEPLDSYCPVNGGDYECELIVGNAAMFDAVTALPGSSTPVVPTAKPVTPTVGLVYTADPMPASRKTAPETYYTDAVAGKVTVAGMARAYTGADSWTNDLFARVNVDLLADNGCRVIFSST